MGSIMSACPPRWILYRSCPQFRLVWAPKGTQKADRQTHSLKDAKRNWVKEEGGSFVRFFSWRPRRSNDIEARNFSEGSKAKVLSYPTRAGRRAQGAGRRAQGQAVIFHLREHRTRAPLGTRSACLRSRSVMMTANGHNEEALPLTQDLESGRGGADRKKLRPAGRSSRRR